MHNEWLDLGPIDAFREDAPVLRKVDGHRFACVRAGDAVHAIDDRCPHQGYPLSQGSVRDGVLTCEWHNWKFDLATGACPFGGDAVRRYPTEVHDGRVRLRFAIDLDAEAARLRRGLREAIARDQMPRALREALRLGDVAPAAEHLPGARLGRLRAGFALLAEDGADRSEYGFEHGMAALADLCAWVERGWIPAEEAFVAGMHAVAEPSAHLPARPVPALDPSGSDEGLAVDDALVNERRDEAEARVRRIARERGPDAALDAMIPFVARHLYEYGHGAIFLTKAHELAKRFPEHAEAIMGSIAVTLAWATAETSLPPFAATRAALARLDAIAPVLESSWDRAQRRAFEAEVLAGEGRAADATIAAIAAGIPAKAILLAIAHAAAIRTMRFDRAWEDRADAEVTVLGVTHTITFAEAALRLAERASPGDARRLAVLAAAFVGKVRRGDHENHSDPRPFSDAAHLADAVAARDAGRAIHLARALDPAERRAAYATVAPFAAFDAATRPIFYAHTVKNTEALRRLDEEDPEADDVYLTSLLSYVVPIRRELRVRRTAHIARKFLEDGRPPEDLY